MARLLEHHAKDLLERAGIPIPRREPAKSPREAVALILGRFIEDFPRGRYLRSRGAVIGRRDDAPSAKLRRLEEARALVSESIEDALRLLQSRLEVEVRP